MPNTISYSFGDILLIPFPFTDQTTLKKRPAVVVSSDAYNRERSDLILMAVTSHGRPSPGLGETNIQAWKEAGLLKPSSLKPLLATVEQGIVIRRLGSLQEQDRHSLRHCLNQILGG